MYTVFVWIPNSAKPKPVLKVINSAVENASEKLGIEINVKTPAEIRGGFEALYKVLERTDVLLTDVGLSRSAIYALGYMDALRKPAILISEEDRGIPYAAHHRKIFLYDAFSLENIFFDRLVDTLIETKQNPDSFTVEYVFDAAGQLKSPSAFVSYSHADLECLRRLEVHLKPLEQDGLIDVWADTRIKAGEDWEERIKTALDKAAIAVLLISADFLASDFIVKDELPPLLLAAAKGGTTILPLILKPCRFVKHGQLSKFQAINSPSEPLLSLNEIEQEKIYVKLVDRIELVIRSQAT